MKNQGGIICFPSSRAGLVQAVTVLGGERAILFVLWFVCFLFFFGLVVFSSQESTRHLLMTTSSMRLLVFAVGAVPLAGGFLGNGGDENLLWLAHCRSILS